jgi:outer membrane protein assembly factor BamB
MFIHRPLKTTLSFALLIPFIQNIFAQDWPQWRGANRDGAITGFTAPKTWPDQLKQMVIKKYHVAEKPTWAHPAIVGKNILIKDETTLALWRLE